MHREGGCLQKVREGEKEKGESMGVFFGACVCLGG